MLASTYVRSRFGPMAFQTRNLWLVALGIEGDAPPSSLQPPLPDGMHLRWTFDPAKGFPWFGYYLFRRPSAQKGDPICLSRYWVQQHPGTVGATQIAVGIGEVSSDQPLTFTEEFPPPGVVEVDLHHRSYVRYDATAGAPVRWAEATIGFTREAGGEDCLDFRRDKPATVDNPLRRQGVQLTVFDEPGKPRPTGRVWNQGGNVGWDAGRL